MKIKTISAFRKIGNWTIEYPTTCNGGATHSTAFVCGKWASDFVSLYGQGRIGIGSGITPPASVIKYLEQLSRSIEQ
jgi:hypothetical protein